MAAADRRYLRQKGATWYLRVKIPAALAGRYGGRTHIVESLGRDYAAASVRRWRRVAELATEFDLAKRLDPDGRRAADYRADLRQAVSAGDEDVIGLVESLAADTAEAMLLSGRPPSEVRGWYSLATARGATLDELAEQWVAAGRVTEGTRVQYRTAWRELRDFMGGDCVPEAVTDQLATKFVYEVLAASGQAYETVRRKATNLSGFWAWMQTRGHVARGVNPWAGRRLSEKYIGRSSPKKRAYTEPELIILFRRQPAYPGLADLMLLGLYTGCRIEELAGRQVDQITHRDGVAFMQITAAKTAAGNRRIAITHPAAVRVLEARTKGAPPGSRLFPEFKRGGA